MGRWRALALLAVYALAALHYAHYASTGRTLSPLEPSESMRFSNEGLVNAGLLFFALTIGTTLVLGRWFCGWACHVVALQDLCRWMLGRIGIRPRPIDLGILSSVPWLAFAYMFGATFVLRILKGIEHPEVSVELYTQDFWHTFPSAWVALLTFLVCGFAIVYVLGAKSFCSYGCPYGAIFGVADQLAPVRIRVTDACEGCGHCTSVCTSNVKVHREVRDFGMVVDPGCMKCLDCVSVCPKDALYVGAGAPALLAKRRAPGADERPSRSPAWARWALLLVFMFAAFLVFTSYNGDHSAYVNPPEWSLALALAGVSFLVAVVFRGKAERRLTYSLPEECLLAAGFLGSMLALRGLHGWVPLLFGFGLSAIAAFALVHAVRLFTKRDLSVQRIVLKGGGTWRAAGVGFALVMTGILVGFGFAFDEQLELRAAARGPYAHEVVSQGARDAQAGAFEHAEAAFRRARAIDPDSTEALANLGAILCQTGRPREGVEHFEALLSRSPDDLHTRKLAAFAWYQLGEWDKSLGQLRRASELAPDDGELHELMAEVYDRLGDAANAARERQRANAIPLVPPR